MYNYNFRLVKGTRAGATRRAKGGRCRSHSNNGGGYKFARSSFGSYRGGGEADEDKGENRETNRDIFQRGDSWVVLPLNDEGNQFSCMSA